MDIVEYCRERASQCRRLAKTITARGDPAINALLALAAEFDAKAAAITARAAAEAASASNGDHGKGGTSRPNAPVAPLP